MKKRTLALLLCIALVTLVAVNDTLATEVGNIFKTIVDSLGNVLDVPTADKTQLDVDLISTTDGVLIPAHYDGDFSWDKVSGVVAHKYTSVQNTKAEAAYVRICIAVREADCLKFRLAAVPEGNDGYDFDPPQNITISGKAFTLYTFDYQQLLTQGSSTPVITVDFALIKDTDNDDLAALGTDFVQVKSFAIQADAFVQMDEQGKQLRDANNQPVLMSASDALEMALGSIATFNPFN